MLKLKRGINIGDHFEDEAVKTEDYVNPMQEWYYDLISKLGFDHIRLPVRWSHHCSPAPDYAIDKSFMADVKSTVDRFIDMNIAVILDVHHFRECMGHPLENEIELCRLWEQISLEFAGYPDEMLIFEILNEPDWQAKADDWNIVQNDVISLLRKNHPTRWLMVGAVNYNEIYQMDKLVLPKDDKRLIGTFHYYFPLEFTHQGAPWTTRYIDLHDIHWTGTDDELKFMHDTINIAVQWGEKWGLPLHLGEFGVYKKANMQDRAAWTRTLRLECEKYGISWSYWELNRNFGISEPDCPKLHEQLVDALLND